MTNLQKQQMKKLIDKHTKYKMELIEFLYDNRKRLSDEEVSFDYPDYGGMPKRLSKRLSSYDVDIIQDMKSGLKNVSIKALCQWFQLSF